MNISIATRNDEGRWDAFVSTHPDATPYHLCAWTRAIKNAYGFDSYRLIAEVDGKIQGVLPMVSMGFPFRHKNFIAVPYGDVGGVLANHCGTEELLIAAAHDLALSESASIVELRGGTFKAVPNIPNIQKIPTNKVRMILELPENCEKLWNGFKSKLRSQIRKAEKNGLVFASSNERVTDFYTVFSRNMRDLGSPVHSRKWFEEIVKQYGENAKLSFVSCGQKVVGAAITLRVGRKISIPWASTLHEYNKLSPNMLLYWGLLKYATENDCISFDFGRSTPGQGTYKFKKQWGALERPLEWWIITNSGNTQYMDIAGANRELAAKIWQRIPLTVANWIGPCLRKYISL